MPDRDGAAAGGTGPSTPGDLRQKVLQGGAYLVARKGVGVAINSSCLIVLLALIGPSEYGLFMAALSINIVLLTVAKSGIHVYLVRHPDPLVVREYHQAFTLLLLSGLLIVGVVILALPLVDAWMRLEGFRWVAMSLFAGLPLALLGALPTAQLERSLDYRRITRIDLAAQLVYQPITLTLAYFGFGAFSMVIGWWAQHSFANVALYRAARYRPRLAWDGDLVRRMLSFGLSFSASHWIRKGRGLVNPLIVAPLLGPAAVGYVALAHRLCELLCFAKEAAERMSISAIARVQHERARLLRGLEQGIELQILATGPVLVLATVVAPFVLHWLPGERAAAWVPVTQVFPFIAFAYLASSLFNLQVSALYVLGENLRVGVFNAVNLIVLMVLAWLLIPHFGLVGFGLAEMGSVLTYVLVHRRATKRFGRARFGLAMSWAAAFGLLLLWQTIGWFAVIGIVMVALSSRTRTTLAAYVRTLRQAVTAYRRTGETDPADPATDPPGGAADVGSGSIIHAGGAAPADGSPPNDSSAAGQRLKVLISAYACAPGRGSEPGIGWNTAREMARFHDVWVLTRTADARGSQRIPIEAEIVRQSLSNIHVIYLDLPRWMIRGVNKQVRYYLWQVAAYFAVRRLHTAVKFDLSHHVSWVRSYSPSLLALLPVPFVWGPVGGGEAMPRSFRNGLGRNARTSEFVRRLARILTRWDPLVRLTARRSTLALANSQETAERIASLGAKRIRILGESGLDEWVSSITSERNMMPEPSFASMTRLVYWKGVHLALEAFARTGDTGASFRVVGNGPEKERLKRLASDLGIANRVVFEEELSRAEWMDRLQSCDALVHPCIYNSGGAISLEAMALGTPVICLDRGGIRQQVPDGAGFRIAADNAATAVEGLATAMRQLIDDRSKGVAAGQRAREHVLRHFSWRERGEVLHRFYLEAVASHHSPDAAADRIPGRRAAPSAAVRQPLSLGRMTS